MRIESSDEGGVTVVRLAGVIRLGESAQEFSAYLEELLDRGRGPVLLDLSRIDHVDSTGLGELVGYLQRFADAGRGLALLRPHERIMALLRLTKLDEIFPVHDDLDRALAELGE